MEEQKNKRLKTKEAVEQLFKLGYSDSQSDEAFRARKRSSSSSESPPDYIKPADSHPRLSSSSSSSMSPPKSSKPTESPCKKQRLSSPKLPPDHTEPADEESDSVLVLSLSRYDFLSFWVTLLPNIFLAVFRLHLTTPLLVCARKLYQVHPRNPLDVQRLKVIATCYFFP